MVTVEYVWHDCFVVGMEGVNLVFDYWLDVDGQKREKPGFLSGLDREKPLFVFVSHFHKDHYNPAIFSWAEEFPEIRYIVSHDVWKRMKHIVSETSVYSGPKVDAGRVYVLRPGGAPIRFCNGKLRVSAYPSTDAGNSYMVEAEGRKIFHAGDLNAWVWKDESTQEEINKALGDFKACLKRIRVGEEQASRQQGEDGLPADDIDICLFPVDSRIGRDYWEGAAMFVREFNVWHFFPMHFALGDEEEREKRKADAIDFEAYSNPERGEYVALTESGERKEIL